MGVAIKYFKFEGEWLVEKSNFLYEVTVTSMLSTFKHFVPCLGANMKEAFLVMPFAQRGSLQDLLANETMWEISWKKKMQMLWSVACALRSMHRIGILHRDLKPHNVFVDNNFNCYLGDFGIARQVHRKRSKTLNVGTTSYMAPELFVGNGRYDEGIDAFSFAMLCWQMITNSAHPYDGMKAFEVPEFIASGGRLPIPEGTPSFMVDLIQDCWQSDPTLRPKSSTIVKILAEHVSFVPVHENIQPDFL